MSDEKQEAPKLSLLDQLKIQRAQFIAQRDFNQTNLNQLIGAIHACDVMIKAHEDEAAALVNELPKEDKGEQENVQTDEQKPEQAS